MTAHQDRVWKPNPAGMRAAAVVCAANWASWKPPRCPYQSWPRRRPWRSTARFPQLRRPGHGAGFPPRLRHDHPGLLRVHSVRKTYATAGSVNRFNGTALGARTGFLSGWTLLFTYVTFTVASAAEVGLFFQTFMSELDYAIPDFDHFIDLEVERCG
jgi:hypothetical protein